MTTQVNTFTDIEAEDYATTGKNATINCVVLSDGPITQPLPSEYVYKMISSDSYQSYIRAGYINVQIKNWTSTISSSEQSYLQIPSIYRYKADSVKYINVNVDFNKQLYPDNSGYIGYPILDCEELQIALPDQSIITVTPDMWKVVNIASNSTNTTYWYAVELNKAELYLGLDNDGQLYIYTTESAGAPKYQYEDLQLKILIGECGDGAPSDFDRHIDEYLYDVYIFSKPESTVHTLTTNGFNYISFFNLTSLESEPTVNSKLLASRQLGYYIPFITGQNGKIDKIFIRVKSDRWDESKITIDVIFDPDYQEHLDLVAGTDIELTTGVGFTPNHSVNPSSQEITLPQFIANDTTINITNNTNAKNIFQYVNSPTRLQMDTNDYLNYSYYLWYYWKPDDIIEQLNIWYNYFGTWNSDNEKITITIDNTTLHSLPGPYIGFNDEFGSFLYSYWYNQTENQLILILAGSNQYHHTDIYCVDMSSSTDQYLSTINNGTNEEQYRMKVNRWFNDIYFCWHNNLYMVNVDPDKVWKVTKPVIMDGNQFTYDVRCLFTKSHFPENPTEAQKISTWNHMPLNWQDITWSNLFSDTIEIELSQSNKIRFHYNSSLSLDQWDSTGQLTAVKPFQFEEIPTTATAHKEPTEIYSLALSDGSYVYYCRYISISTSDYNLIELNKTSSTVAPNGHYYPCLITRSQSTEIPSLIAGQWYPAIMEQTTTQFISLQALSYEQSVFPCNVVLPDRYFITPEILSQSELSIYNPEFSDIGDVIITAGNDNQHNRHYFLQPLIANQSLNPSVDEDLPSTVEIKIDELNAKFIQNNYNISSCFNQYTIDNPHEQTPLIAMYVLSTQHIRWLEEHNYAIYYVGPAYTVGRRTIDNKTQYLFLSKTINGCKSDDSCYNWERLRVILDEGETIDSFADTGIIIKDSSTKKYYELKDLTLSNRTAKTFTPDIKDRYVTVSFVTNAAEPLPRRIFPTATN